jgi:8-oxo-dGTP pyrophosphatase MutT (NUDIX family)
MKREPTMPVTIDDPRLIGPQCQELTPIETIHRNPWFEVRNRGGYYTAEYRQPQVIVLPVIEDNAVVMVRVKRPVIADVTLELPAGGFRRDERPRQAAARELYEETGIHIDSHRLMPLIPLSNSPNRNPCLIHIFQLELTKEEYDQRDGHDHEIDDVAMFDLDDIRKMILGGQIFVGVPLAILGRFLLERAQETQWRQTDAGQNSMERGGTDG